jgi:hypothetical protein
MATSGRAALYARVSTSDRGQAVEGTCYGPPGGRWAAWLADGERRDCLGVRGALFAFLKRP